MEPDTEPFRWIEDPDGADAADDDGAVERGQIVHDPTEDDLMADPGDVVTTHPVKVRQHPRVRGAERAHRALVLRLGGASYEEIGKALGISKHGAQKAYLRAKAGVAPHPLAEEARSLAYLRLERLLSAVWQDALEGDLRAVDRARALIRDEVELLGASIPKEEKAHGQGGGTTTIVAVGGGGGDYLSGLRSVVDVEGTEAGT